MHWFTAKPFMKNRGLQIFIGLALFVIGSVIVYNAFDARGKYMPWPASSILPW
jgi:hypothetical protein